MATVVLQPATGFKVPRVKHRDPITILKPVCPDEYHEVKIGEDLVKVKGKGGILQMQSVVGDPHINAQTQILCRSPTAEAQRHSPRVDLLDILRKDVVERGLTTLTP